MSPGVVRLYSLTAADAARMEELMGQYLDNPMDLADASLVVAAEALDIDRVFTLDSHFHAYRIGGARAFQVVPQCFRLFLSA